MTDEVTAAFAGGESAFAALTERYRRELHVHCYRMLASFDEAEDAVQETFLRAWRARDSFDGSALVRAWLYRIATNVCLDAIRRSARRLTSMETFREVPWITPYPDRLLDEIAPSDEEPEAVVVTRETIELAFLAALQVLPPRQRATLIARDVLGWPASETATALETSVASVNSALQRARATLQAHLPARRSEWSAGEPSEAERALLASFIEAHERGDAALAVSIAAQGPADHDAAVPDAVRGPRRHRAAARGRPGRGRLAAAADRGQPDADGRQLPARAGRHDPPPVQARRPARRRRPDRRDHDVRARAVPAVRAAADGLGRGVAARPATSAAGRVVSCRRSSVG